VKSGIDYDPHSSGKSEALYRFIRGIRPYVLERYSLGPDLNVKLNELDDIVTRLGMPPAKAAIAQAQGLDLEGFTRRYTLLSRTVNHVTLGKIRSGFGLAAACLGTLDFLKIPREEATVAIQGFGGLGAGAAYSLYNFGVKVVGLADEGRSLISGNEHSLDIKGLVENSRDGLIPQSDHIGEYFHRDRIYDVDCDILVPAAIEDAIVEGNAKTLSVKAVVPGANLAVTEAAEKILHERGILTLPDFVPGCGGSLSMDALFGPPSDPSVQEVFDHVEKRMRAIVRNVLERSRKDNILPRQAALAICSETPVYPNAKPYGPLEE
jgi:glutamate dehydrogenase (NAD(P)+)